MTRLNWNAIGERFYEAGIDRGVLYPSGVGSLGIPWHGLVNVVESSSGGAPVGLYLDGFKYLNYTELEEFEFSIEAFTYPEEFALCDGTYEENGFGFTAQPRKEFNFSYRTLIGNDVDEFNHAYKIHLVYNALVKPSSVSRETVGENTDPNLFTWDATTRPEVISGVRPSSHLIIDSRLTHPSTLSNIEEYLYGSPSRNSALPSPEEVRVIFQTMISRYGHGPYGHMPYGGSIIP